MSNKGNKLIREVKTSFVGEYGIIVPILCVLFCWLVIPLICLLVMCFKVSARRYEIYEDRIIYRSGILHKFESITLLEVVRGSTIRQSFKGRIFNYGEVFVRILGREDTYCLSNIKCPNEIKEIIDKMVMENRDLDPMMNLVHKK